jgi:hypothetical protein
MIEGAVSATSCHAHDRIVKERDRMPKTFWHLSSMLLTVWLVLLGAGCAGVRPTRPPAELLAQRQEHNAEQAEKGRAFGQRIIERLKARYDAHPEAPLTYDILVLSGGGDWGAFGTGALIAPFAFLGDELSLDTIVELYRHPRPDLVKQRWPLYFLPANESFATVPGLEHELRARVNMAMIRRIAAATRQGRFLLVNTTDVDDGGSWVWDVGSEAQRAVETGDVDRGQRILLASSGIPGAFPFRVIDGSLYVDGGVTGNILYGGGTREERSLPARWAMAYPQLPIPTVRYWVIFNNQLRPLPQVTAPTWTAIVARSLEMGTRAATVTAIRHLFTQAEISQLKRGGDVEVRVVAVPDDFVPPKAGVFIKETMNALADLGERMGADPTSWRTEAP